MSDKPITKTIINRYAADGLPLVKKRPYFNEATGYKTHASKDLEHEKEIVRTYANLVVDNCQALLDKTITIEEFEANIPLTDDPSVSHLIHMRNSVIRTYSPEKYS